MKNVIKVPLSVAGITELERQIERYKQKQIENTKKFLKRLAEEGLNIASAKFSSAVYDGTNDVSVSVEDRGENVKAVVATGNATLFIEFGTGVTYPDNHPEAAKNGMVRGEYGYGYGKRKTWSYYGEPGTNGQVKVNSKGNAVVLTHGNPANMPMYETVKELESKIAEIAKEVFT